MSSWGTKARAFFGREEEEVEEVEGEEELELRIVNCCLSGRPESGRCMKIREGTFCSVCVCACGFLDDFLFNFI